MNIEVYLELNPPEVIAVFLDDLFEVKAKLEENQNIQCHLQEPLAITATLSGEYELEG